MYLFFCSYIWRSGAFHSSEVGIVYGVSLLSTRNRAFGDFFFFETRDRVEFHCVLGQRPERCWYSVTYVAKGRS